MQMKTQVKFNNTNETQMELKQNSNKTQVKLKCSLIGSKPKAQKWIQNQLNTNIMKKIAI